MSSEGFWIRYGRDGSEIFPINEHERALRFDPEKFKLSSDLIAEFGDYQPVEDRNEFLLHVMSRAPLMRVRGHGADTTFEFSTRKTRQALDAIYDFAQQEFFGPYSGMKIVNFGTKESAEMTYKDFEAAMNADEHEKILSEAVEMKLPNDCLGRYFKNVKRPTENKLEKNDMLGNAGNSIYLVVGVFMEDAEEVTDLLASIPEMEDVVNDMAGDSDPEKVNDELERLTGMSIVPNAEGWAVGKIVSNPVISGESQIGEPIENLKRAAGDVIKHLGNYGQICVMSVVAD